MEDERAQDDSSHYEVSLTAGQAFVAFVLLLFSLAASFAFGVTIGRGGAGEGMALKKEPAVISEASSLPSRSRIVELGVPKNHDFATDAGSAEAPSIQEEAPALPEAATGSSPVVPAVTTKPPVQAPAPSSKPAQNELAAKPEQQPASPAVPHFAQVLSSSDKKAAEDLAAKLIDAGMTSTYVERSMSQRGMIYRVRVKYASEAEARSDVTRLGSLTKGEIWVSKQ